jgi:hypothetical protein
MPINVPRRALLSLAATMLITWPATTHAAPYTDGFYVGLGIGFTHVEGENAIALEQLSVFTPVTTTDFGSGLAFELRTGYNILGYASVEASIAGNGSFDLTEGIAYPAFQVRLHPIQFFVPFEERFWDVSLFGGVGYAIGGYEHEELASNDTDAKGWEGHAFTAGIGFGMSPVPWLSIDIDLRMIFPQLTTYIVDWDDDQRDAPTKTPSMLIFAPTLQFTFRVPSGDPEPEGV